MAQQAIRGMGQAAIAGVVRQSAETAVGAAASGIAEAGGGPVSLGTLNVRVSHDATARDLADAVQRAIEERLR
jgi:hypothetical protein